MPIISAHYHYPNRNRPPPEPTAAVLPRHRRKFTIGTFLAKSSGLSVHRYPSVCTYLLLVCTYLNLIWTCIRGVFGRAPWRVRAWLDNQRVRAWT